MRIVPAIFLLLSGCGASLSCWETTESWLPEDGVRGEPTTSLVHDGKLYMGGVILPYAGRIYGIVRRLDDTGWTTVATTDSYVELQDLVATPDGIAAIGYTRIDDGIIHRIGENGVSVVETGRNQWMRAGVLHERGLVVASDAAAGAARIDLLDLETTERTPLFQSKSMGLQSAEFHEVVMLVDGTVIAAGNGTEEGKQSAGMFVYGAPPPADAIADGPIMTAQLDVLPNGVVVAAAAHPTEAAVAIGGSRIGPEGLVWDVSVWRPEDGAWTTQVMPSLQLSEDYTGYSELSDLTFTPDGHIVAVGYARPTSTTSLEDPRRWITASIRPGAKSWTILDEYVAIEPTEADTGELALYGLPDSTATLVTAFNERVLVAGAASQAYDDSAIWTVRQSCR